MILLAGLVNCFGLLNASTVASIASKPAAAFAVTAGRDLNLYVLLIIVGVVGGDRKSVV